MSATLSTSEEATQAAPALLTTAAVADPSCLPKDTHAQHPLHLKEEADGLFARQCWNDAVDKYTLALSIIDACPVGLTLDPAYHYILRYHVLMNRALANSKAHRHVDAVDDAKAAIVLVPDEPFSYFRLCEVLFSARQYHQAQEAAERGLRVTADIECSSPAFAEARAELQEAFTECAARVTALDQSSQPRLQRILEYELVEPPHSLWQGILSPSEVDDRVQETEHLPRLSASGDATLNYLTTTTQSQESATLETRGSFADLPDEAASTEPITRAFTDAHAQTAPSTTLSQSKVRTGTQRTCCCIC